MTDDEVADLFKAQGAIQVKKSAAAADECLALSDEELDKVAGGKDHENCSDTYKDNENCWFDDNCKHLTHHYYDPYDPVCDTYSYCGTLTILPDCKFGRVGGC